PEIYFVSFRPIENASARELGAIEVQFPLVAGIGNPNRRTTRFLNGWGAAIPNELQTRAGSLRSQQYPAVSSRIPIPGRPGEKQGRKDYCRCSSHSPSV